MRLAIIKKKIYMKYAPLTVNKERGLSPSLFTITSQSDQCFINISDIIPQPLSVLRK